MTSPQWRSDAGGFRLLAQDADGPTTSWTSSDGHHWSEPSSFGDRAGDPRPFPGSVRTQLYDSVMDLYMEMYGCSLDEAEEMEAPSVALVYGVKNDGFYITMEKSVRNGCAKEGLLRYLDYSIVEAELNFLFDVPATGDTLIAQNKGGSIISTASMSAHIINVPQKIAQYCASKAAVLSLVFVGLLALAGFGLARMPGGWGAHRSSQISMPTRWPSTSNSWSVRI